VDSNTVFLIGAENNRVSVIAGSIARPTLSELKRAAMVRPATSGRRIYFCRSFSTAQHLPAHPTLTASCSNFRHADLPSVLQPAQLLQLFDPFSHLAAASDIPAALPLKKHTARDVSDAAPESCSPVSRTQGIGAREK